MVNNKECAKKYFFYSFRLPSYPLRDKLFIYYYLTFILGLGRGINEKTGHIKRQCIFAFLSILETLAGRQVQILEGILHCQRCCSIHRTTADSFQCDAFWIWKINEKAIPWSPEHTCFCVCMCVSLQMRLLYTALHRACNR